VIEADPILATPAFAAGLDHAGKTR